MSWEISHGLTGIRYNPGAPLSEEQAEEIISKAFTTGSGPVAANATGGQALRVQFLKNTLNTVSFEQDDAGMMKIIKKERVGSNTIEWSNYTAYGTAGDGFVGETGFNAGSFDVPGADDNFARQVQTIKYMGVQRTVGLISTLVNNIQNPERVSVKGATMALVSAMNIAIYDGNEATSATQYNGFSAQIRQHVGRNPGDADILFDMGGQPLTRDALNQIALLARRKYGRATLLQLTQRAKGDAIRSLYPSLRSFEGDALRKMGVNTSEFEPTEGPKIKLSTDLMFRANNPLVADGQGSDGKPRTYATATPGFVDYANTPWAAAPTPVAAGLGRYWDYANKNTDTAILGTAPELPSAGYGGNAANRLPNGNYYYAVAAVVNGKESPAWVYGAAAAGIITGATAVTVASITPIVRIDLATTAGGSAALAGLNTATLPGAIVKWRVYRTRTAGVVPTSLGDFDYLMDIGTVAGVSSANSRGFDNGQFIPGTERGFFLTESKGGVPGFFLAQLLPLMKRPLPNLALADLFALLAFVAPILYVPRHHIEIRNIGQLAY